MPVPMPHPFYLGHLPDYTPPAADYAELPSYTSKPREEEYFLNYDSQQTCTKHGKMTYSCEDMSVTLGPRIWGFNTPTYGYEGVIRGDINLSEKVRPHASRLCISLIITAAAKGLKPRRLFHKKKQIYSSSVDPRPAGVFKFDIAIPCEITVGHERMLSPPSLSVSAGHSIASVKYEVVFTFTKRGFYKTESSLRFPIVYLPKTRPSRPPIKVMPHADCHGWPYCEEQGVHTDVIAFDCPRPHMKDKLPTDIYYSRPQVESFASGSDIPIVLTVKNISADTAREYLKEFAVGISGTIQKRTQIVSPLLRGGYASADAKLDYVVAFTTHDIGGGVYQLHGALGTGKEGCESSWRVPHTIQVQYIIYLQSSPKPKTSFALPRFSHTDVVVLTTDHWGTNGYELSSTSGRPVPAIGLYKSGSAITYDMLDTPENSDPNRYKITV